MRLAKVRGTVVASVKASGLSSHKLLFVEDVDPRSPMESQVKASGDGLYVAIDLVGAGDDEIVLVSKGSAARVDSGGSIAPTDAAVVGIVDTVKFGGVVTFVKR